MYFERIFAIVTVLSAAALIGIVPNSVVGTASAAGGGGGSSNVRGGCDGGGCSTTRTEDEILNVYEYLNRARCESAATILQAALKCTRCGKIIRFLDYY